MVLKMAKMVLGAAFGKASTRRYPYVKREPFPATRGKVAININACTFCGLCQKRCPTGAIAVTRAEKKWSINPFQCISCGACVDACPKKCLTLENQYTAASTRKEAITFQADSTAGPTK